MTVDEFHHLLNNCSQIIELAMAEEADLMQDFLNEAPPGKAEPTDEAIAAEFEGLDFDALDGIEAFNSPDIGANTETDSANNESEKAVIEKAFSAADIATIEQALNQVPATLPQLDNELSPEQIQQWLPAFKADDDAITDLVVAVRAAAPN